MPCFLILCITYLAHHIHAISNHNEDYAHIFCKGHDEVSEVFRLHYRCLLVEFMQTHKSFYYIRDTFSELILHAFLRNMTIYHAGIEYCSNHTVPAESYFFYRNHGSLHAHQHRIKSESITLYGVILCGFDNVFLQSLFIIRL